MEIKISIVILACVSCGFGQSTDSSCEGFKPELDSYVVPKGQSLTVRFSLTSSDTCSDKLVSVIVATSAKDAPTYQHKPLCQILISNNSEDSQTCSYSPSTKTFKVRVAFTEVGEMWLMLTGLYHTASRSPPRVAVTVIEPTEPTEVLYLHRIGGTRGENIEVREHSSLKLICLWHPGSPPKDAHLVKDGVLLIRQQPTTSQLTSQIEFAINDIGCQDGGIYSCEAAGAVKNQTLKVTVHCTKTTPRYSAEGLTRFTNGPFNMEVEQTTSIEGIVSPGTDIDNKMLIAIGCILFLIIIIAVLSGIVIRRKVSTPTQPPPSPVPDENVIELQQVSATQGAGIRVSTLSAHVYQEIADDFIPDQSIDADGYTQPRLAFLPPWSTRPKQRPLLPSGRGNISSPSSSYANTASGETSTRRPAPLPTSAKTGANVAQPKPNKSDVLEATTGGYMPMGGTAGGYMPMGGTTGGYMPMGGTTGGYTQMTRPTTPASATHITPQTTEGTSTVETPHVYANDEKEVTKCTQPSAKAKDQPYENIK